MLAEYGNNLSLCLVLRLMGNDSLVSKDAASVGGGEAPVNFQLGAIGPAVPRRGAAAQFAQRRYLLAAQIGPAAVLGGVVHRETVPQPMFHVPAEGLSNRLLAMSVEVVHHQMNGAGIRMTCGDALQRPANWGMVRFLVAWVSCRPRLGSTMQNTLAVPRLAYS